MPYQSDHIFDEGNTIELSQIDDKVLGPLHFQCAIQIRCPQKEFANLEDGLVSEFCRWFLLIKKPDQFFKNPSILSLAIQGPSFLKGFNVIVAPETYFVTKAFMIFLYFFREFLLHVGLSSRKSFHLFPFRGNPGSFYRNRDNNAGHGRESIPCKADENKDRAFLV
jgi:hypothetical protein